MSLEKIFTEMAYVKGSLINIDLDGDGVDDGFSFRLRNPPIPLGGKIVGIEIYIDGKPIPKDKVFIIVGEQVARSSDVGKDSPITFMPGTASIFMFLTGKGLEEGTHRVLIKSWLEGFEDVWIPFRFEDEVGSEEVKITFRREEADFSYPIILSSGLSYAVLSRSGNLSTHWNWMGVKYDVGGLYVPPARVVGPMRVKLRLRGREIDLSEHAASFTHGPGYLKVIYEIDGGTLVRRIFLPPGLNCLVDDFYAKGLSDGELIVEGTGAPVPYGLLGLTPQSVTALYDKSVNGLVFWSKYMRYYGAVGSTARKLLHSIEGQVNVSKVSSPSPSFQLIYKLDERAKIIVSGSIGDVRKAIEAFDAAKEPHAISRTILHYVNELNRTTSIETDDPEINLAFDLAKLALFYLKMKHPEIGVGVMAGVPRFPTFWGRDSGWVLPAYISISDLNFVKNALENFFSHAHEGEIPMIIGGKGFLHSTSYGSIDATLYYPHVIFEYVKTSGDLEFLHKWYGLVKEMINWGFGRDVDGDKFLDHGGSLTGLLPVPDTTWMDHIDRKKSAVEVQALWSVALRYASRLAEIAGDAENAAKWAEESETIRVMMERKYWNEGEGYFYDTMRPDGRMDPSIRPNAMVALIYRLVDEGKAVKALKRIELPDMTAPWGVRTLSALDPRYDPKAYHDGCVWPLVTGWTAMAEFSYGRAEQGYRYLKAMAGQILGEAGMYAELYRGDREEPFNACILQAWSTAMFINAIFSMLGIERDALHRTLRIEPRLPSSFKLVEVRRLRMGSTHISLTINILNQEVTVHNAKRGMEITVSTPSESERLPPGSKTTLSLKPPATSSI